MSTHAQRVRSERPPRGDKGPPASLEIYSVPGRILNLEICDVNELLPYRNGGHGNDSAGQSRPCGESAGRTPYRRCD